MKMSNSSNKIRENINIKTPEQNNLKQFVKKRISLQDYFIKEKIYFFNYRIYSINIFNYFFILY